MASEWREGGAPLLGAVLAGGTSRRFGRDKSDARVAGVTMLERAVSVLSESCDEVVVVSSRAETPPGPWRRISDLREGFGPLAGIETALEAAHSGGYAAVFVLACDLPLVSPETVRKIVDGIHSAEAAAPTRNGDPPFEPLCAVYRASLREAVAELLDSGERAAWRLIESVDAAFVDVGPEAAFNVNTEEDLARAEKRLDSPRAAD